jgi:hypothetical protein
MSLRANCRDNAVAERFSGTLKTELIYRRPWLTRESAREAIGEYIEVFDNRFRRLSTKGYVSPAEFEEMRLRKTGKSTRPLFQAANSNSIPSSMPEHPSASGDPGAVHFVPEPISLTRSPTPL